MTIENIMKKYSSEIRFEVSEMTFEECLQLDREMEAAGFKYNRTEPGYISCLFAYYELMEG